MMSKQPTHRVLTAEEEFLWTVCAFMAGNGYETEVAYKAGSELVELAGVRFPDEVVVPVGVKMLAGRPHVGVNGVKVLRGAATGPKTLARMQEALLAEYVTCKKDREAQQQGEAFDARKKKLAAQITSANWSCSSYPYYKTDKNDDFETRFILVVEMRLPIGALLDRDDVTEQLQAIRNSADRDVEHLKAKLLTDYEKKKQGSETE
jgi:hypothetical protein